MLALARNGFTAAEVEAALHAVSGQRQIAYRHYMIDPYDGSTIRQLYSVVGCRLTHRRDDAIPRVARYTFRRQLLTLAAYADQVRRGSGLLVYWRLGEASGTSAADSSGNSRTGTYAGGIAYSQASLIESDRSNTSVKFNGSDTQVSIADAAWMDVSHITLAAWIKTTGTAMRILSRNSAWNIIVGAAGQFIGRVTTSSVETTFTSQAKINDGKPHFVVMTKDASFVRLFVDGYQVLKTAHAGNIDAAATDIFVGTQQGGGGRFNGWIDEVSIWSRALSSGEIRNLWQTGANDRNEFDSTRDRIQPQCGIRVGVGNDLDTDYAWFPRGKFLMSDEDQEFDITGEQVTIDCPDQTRLLLDDAFTAPHVVASGTTYTAAMKAILDAAGLQSNVVPTTLTLPADRSWPTGTPRMTALDDLAKAAIYKRVWFDSEGTAQVQPYVADIARQPEYTYTDVQSGVRLPIVLTPLKTRRELASIPNRLITVRTHPELGVASKTEDNIDITSPVSIPRRAGRIVAKVIEVESPDETNSLTAITQRMLRDFSQVTRETEFETPVMPHHEHDDTLRLVNSRAGLNDNIIETGWEHEAEPGARMRHTVVSPVSVV